MIRPCRWCREPIPGDVRPDALYCSKACRQRFWRFGRHFGSLPGVTAPRRFAYADPPYPGKAGLYVGHADYNGEVDHRALLVALSSYDGFALSTNSGSIQRMLVLCHELGIDDVLVGSWFRGPHPHPKPRLPRDAWEPVLYRGGRDYPSEDRGENALVWSKRARREPTEIVGSKPAAFIAWVFELLGARPGDSFDDLFPGSGGVGRAWALLEERRVVPDPRDGLLFPRGNTAARG